jgi:hypothetical protein
LEVDGKIHSNALDVMKGGNVLALSLPPDIREVNVRLIKMGRLCNIQYPRLRTRYEKLYHTLRTMNRTHQFIAETVALPRGRHLNFPEYHSIQNHFPDIYGINRSGVPGSRSERRKAQAKQLKGYLYFYDQFLANVLSTLKDLPEIFSGNIDLGRTCSFYRLDNRHIPEIEDLYLEKNPEDRMNSILAIIRHHDPFHNRKERILDYLLALYGEKIPMVFLRDFNFYFTGRALKDEVLRCKSALLLHIRGLNMDRASGFNPFNPSWNTDNMSGVERKAALYLGLKIPGPHSLIRPFMDDGIIPVSDTERNERALISPGDFPRFKGNVVRCIGRFYHTVPRVHLRNGDDSLPSLMKMIPCFRNGFISESLLRKGIFLENFKTGPSPKGHRHLVFLKISEMEDYEYIASFEDRKSAVDAVNMLQRYITELHRTSEGIHLVDHVLLRPSSRYTKGAPLNPAGATSHEFHDFRVSVVMPEWPARFNNEKFRFIAEETFRTLLPAHIHPCFLWLSFNAMCEFEAVYSAWLDARIGNVRKVWDKTASDLACYLTSAIKQVGKRGD